MVHIEYVLFRRFLVSASSTLRQSVICSVHFGSKRHECGPYRNVPEIRILLAKTHHSQRL